MKSDLDHLMEAHNLDALLITGAAQHNPAMHYFTGNVHVSAAELVKRRGQEPVLFCNPMEREEAAATGLNIRSLSDYPLDALLKETGGDQAQALAARYAHILRDLGCERGRVALHGVIDAGAAFAIFSALQARLPEITLVGDPAHSILHDAMLTKDSAEIARIRRMGAITTSVVGRTADFLTSHAVKDETLISRDGAPLTIGQVKSQINLWLAEAGAETPEGFIFSIGRDAGIPHSIGNPSDPLRLGQTIVFDIYPAEMGGGYWYDFTRTWSLGYATDAAQALYDDVLTVYQAMMGSLKLDAPTAPYQEETCRLFEAQGHPTVRQNPKTTSGYVHSLGHGLGLRIHERPWFRSYAAENEALLANVVFTIEPGLYYPERGLGVRLEDTVWMRPDGVAEIPAPYPLDLVLPMRGRA